LILQLHELGLQVGDLLVQTAASGQRLARQILTALTQGTFLLRTMVLTMVLDVSLPTP
jgi:hypothetical protein